ncbi:MAG: RlmE family RNA methyltransferase [Rhodobacteraceae bacterium]|nr:RlmE family RNA methyltransferase [Paracoccaceae bacterium]
MPKSTPKSKRGSSGRGLKQRVKTARGRTASSNRWLSRQLNDPYVRRAQAEGWRSRAAFKIAELDQRFHIFKPGQNVVDLGAAPGGWTQYAVKQVQTGGREGKVVGIDINEWTPVAGATCLTLDFLDPKAPDELKRALGGQADVVLSDMAAPTTGHPGTDHLRIMALAEAAWLFATEVLAPGGAFVCKVFQGGTEAELLKHIKLACAQVKHAKPPASRKESAEIYLVAQGFKGAK